MSSFTSGFGVVSNLSPAKMDSIFQDEDWDNLIDAYHNLKREEVEVMIDSFVEPDKYKNLDGSMSIRDFLLKKIEDTHQELNS